jgi:hypothetical protein
MATTYTLISSQTLASSAASVTFSAIPSTFTDLVLKASVRNNDTGGGAMPVYFNGDARGASGYSSTFLQGNGSTTGSNHQSPASQYAIDTSGETANTFTSWEMYIPQYNSTGSKPFSVDSAVETNAYTVNYRSVVALLDTNTNISSISLFNVSTLQFVTGSSFYLYGISNA